MKSARVTYSIDWLQLFCKVPTGKEPVWESAISPNADRYGNHHTYTICETKSFIKGYEWSRKVMYRNYDVATIACKPKDERRRKDGGAIKINNAVLYITDWYFFLHDILSTLGWIPMNITRVDLCADFNFFLGGLSPETFMRNYVCKQRKSYVRVGSNAYCVYGKKDMHKNTMESIRWGSRQSGVSVYMYNKTKELNDVKDKPWIRELWKKACLSSTKDVWRVEISITSQGLGLKSLFDSTIHTLFTDDLRDNQMVASMFKCYAGKHFRFLRLHDGAKRKRDLKEIPLLDVTDSAQFRPVSLCENHDTGRMERIVSNKLQNLLEYVEHTDIIDKYKEMDALQRTIDVYNWHHNIKKKVRQQELILDGEAKGVALSILDCHGKQDFIQRVGLARQNIERVLQKVQKYAQSEIYAQPHAHGASPPPQAKRGG